MEKSRIYNQGARFWTSHPSAFDSQHDEMTARLKRETEEIQSARRTPRYVSTQEMARYLIAIEEPQIADGYKGIITP